MLEIDANELRDFIMKESFSRRLSLPVLHGYQNIQGTRDIRLEKGSNIQELLQTYLQESCENEASLQSPLICFPGNFRRTVGYGQ